jgi:hypothetical protein
VTTEETIECPRCSSPQKFPRRLRPTAQQNVKEAFISCTVCPWEQVLGKTTTVMEGIRRSIARLEGRAVQERSHHGQISITTAEAMGRLKQRLAHEQRFLESSKGKS